MRLLVLYCAAMCVFGQSPQYDLLLKGGTVIDPANNINNRRDVAVKDGKIAAVAANIAPSTARKVVDVSPYYVTPGLIDIHAHVTLGRVRPTYPADLNLASGLTTIVDAGTHGAKNFDVLKHNVIDKSQIRVLAFLNIVDSGMIVSDEDEQNPKTFDAKLCAATIQRNRQWIVGVKTAHYWTEKPWDAQHKPWDAVDAALAAGREADVPVMVDFWPRDPERSYAQLILDKMRPGDIHTHVFAQQFPILLPDGKVNPILAQARKRGVIFDLGHGAGSFWWRNALPAVQQGFIPDSISTDLHSANWNGPVVDMITTMSKIYSMGVPLEDVIRRSTVNPAREIRRTELGTLTVGREADIAVLEVRKGKFSYTDCGRARFTGEGKLENRITVRAGRILYDPSGITMVDWEKAPKQYHTSPKLSSDPHSLAEPRP